MLSHTCHSSAATGPFALLIFLAELTDNQQILKLFQVLPESVKAARKEINPRAEIFQLGQLLIHPA